MSRRADGAGLACVDLTVRDRLVIDDVKAATGLDSDANFLRSAAYHFAVHVLGAGAVDTGLFQLRSTRGRVTKSRTA
jgi:hypothetical protein